MVPGNHDVDRSYVEPDFPLWASHVYLRETASPVIWRDVLAKQLQKDPLHSMLAPLTGYNDFAQGYGCRTTPELLAWNRVFEKRLDDGRLLRLHGLNSALISDAGDAAGKLLVSEFQCAHFERTAGVVNLVMCHHPPDWLMDKAVMRQTLKAFAPVALFGHEHSTRVDPGTEQVQLFAGAVQPSRRDPDWLPTYHILQLSTSNAAVGPELVVRIHTREFDKQLFRFRSRRNERDEPVEEHRIRLPDWTQPVGPTRIVVQSGTESDGTQANTNLMPPAEPSTPTWAETAQRELLVHFFRLRAPDRYAAAYQAGLLRDGDDELDPQTMWAEVFRRAVAEEGRLAPFWDAVASKSAEIRDTPNPFRT